jgi:Na+-translocating ferredoxin:NAD+ oxidoreductase RnfC subunit
MPHPLLTSIQEAGVVGAGGAGFPAHVKLDTSAEVVIGNGAECEPLLQADRFLMESESASILEGLRTAMQITGATRGVLYLKKKNASAVDQLTRSLAGDPSLELFLARDYYPAGDEQQIICDVTGRVVPLGSLPRDVGVVVLNVATLSQIAKACRGAPVTERLVTLAGDLPAPRTVRAPIGTSVRHLLALTGSKATPASHCVLLGGPLMGAVIDDWEAPVTKTTSGIVVLPRDHKLARLRCTPLNGAVKMGASVCCQCNYCTLMCPRYNLGLGVEPHKAMRAIAFSRAAAAGDPEAILGCCDCGLCTYYACNFGLSPGRIMTEMKRGLVARGVRASRRSSSGPSSSRELSKLPTSRLLARVDLERFVRHEPAFEPQTVSVSEVRIPLLQHVGKPATCCVRPQQAVSRGAVVGTADGSLSSFVHASIHGTVTAVTDKYVEIRA